MNFFDLHCDTPYECYTKKQEFYVNSLAVSGEQGKNFEFWKQVFAVWIRDDLENPFNFYKSVINDFKNKLKTKPQNLIPLFSVEGGAVLQNDLDRLHILKRDGISLLTLCWNGRNLIAGGSQTDTGLTDFGKQVIYETNNLKIGCDLSHLNKKSFFAALELAKFPLATHSNCDAVCGHKRNLDDEQIKLLCQKGGIIGICFYPDFLNDNVFEAIYENIFHLCEMGFQDHIAIGSDFDGGVMNKKLCKVADVPSLYDFLKQKGLEKELLDKIFYWNAENFIAKL